jgi:hypothetical protein
LPIRRDGHGPNPRLSTLRAATSTYAPAGWHARQSEAQLGRQMSPFDIGGGAAAIKAQIALMSFA